MAVVSTLTKSIGRVQLNNGTDSSGAIKTVAVNLGDLNESYISANTAAAQEAIMTLVGLLEPCLNKTVEAIEVVNYNNLTYQA